MHEHRLTIRDIAIHFAIMLPGYAATIAFRALSFSITMAFLRVWSIIPISLLFLELSVAYYTSSNRPGWGDFSQSLPIIITNLGVTNVGMLAARWLILKERKQEYFIAGAYYEGNNKFVKLSSILSFIHHLIVITTILGLVAYNPCYFEHWICPKFILNNYDGFFYDHMYSVAGGIIGLGSFGLVSTLFLGARSIKIIFEISK